MAEPVKIVIVMEDGSLSTVLSCGVPVDYACISYPDKSNYDDYDEDDFFRVPQIGGDDVEAVGFWGGADADCASHALALFDAVLAHHDGGGDCGHIDEDDAGEGGLPCERCQGNGELVADWDRYMNGQPGDKGDEGTEDCPDCNGTGRVEPAEPVQIEFWIGTVTDDDGDLHSSEIIWGDGMDAADALAEFRRMVSPMPEGYYPAGATWSVHGPFLTNTAAKG